MEKDDRLDSKKHAEMEKGDCLDSKKYVEMDKGDCLDSKKCVEMDSTKDFVFKNSPFFGIRKCGSCSATNVWFVPCATILDRFWFAAASRPLNP